MHRLIEILFGLPRGFLGRDGELSVQFDPRWPGQSVLGATPWNVLLIALAVMLVVYVYRRDGRSRTVRISLCLLRSTLLALVLLLLNRPVLTLGQNRTEPSVLAVLMDDSLSMKVRDDGGDAAPLSRLEAVENLLSDQDGRLLRELAVRHTLRIYRFDRDAQPLAAVEGISTNSDKSPQVVSAVAAVRSVLPVGASTAVLPSIATVLQDLAGQRLAGIVLLSDGRDTPATNIAAVLDRVRNYGVKIYPVIVGSEQAPRNIEVQAATAEDTAFKGDIVNVKATLKGTGYEPGHAVKVVLKDKKTGLPLPGLAGTPAEVTVNLMPGVAQEVELQWKPTDVGNVDVVVEAIKQSGEIDEADNQRTLRVSVLDAKISVLFVDGYPRWEYRYLKNELIRDKSIDVSCLLTSADATFAQEGDKPIRRFPESIAEMMEYDVVLLGDVDPRYFTDNQLQLIAEFVSRNGGGFGMVAGPKYSPPAFRGTPIEALLPVLIGKTEPTDMAGASVTQGFRPVLTRVGQASSIFRFFADRAQNEKFLQADIQPVFWYCRGVVAKPGVGEVYAEHPSDTGPDGRKAPILVLGRFGAGRTLFSAIDDSWRWRFYTGESVFDTYWVQQLRYLARSKKIGQRRLTLTSGQPSYELGQQVRLSLRVLDPMLLQQLPEQLRVELKDETAQTVQVETLQRQEGQYQLYTSSFTADRAGRFTAQLPPVAAGVDMMDLSLNISLPRLELNDPRIDRVQLSRLASETLGKLIELPTASVELLKIPSAARQVPVLTQEPLWSSPLVMTLFVLVITAEWIARKLNGMV